MYSPQQHLIDVLRHAYASNSNGMHAMVEDLSGGEEDVWGFGAEDA